MQSKTSETVEETGEAVSFREISIREGNELVSFEMDIIII